MRRLQEQLGIHAFEQAAVAAVSPNVILSCKGKGITASGYEATQGFVVTAGSQAVGDEVPSMRQYVPGAYELRRELIGNGVLKKSGDYYRFEDNFIFSSPSTAADVVLGCSVNGRTAWKDEKGRTLKELQEREAGVTGAV